MRTTPLGTIVQNFIKIPRNDHDAHTTLTENAFSRTFLPGIIFLWDFFSGIIPPAFFSGDFFTRGPFFGDLFSSDFISAYRIFIEKGIFKIVPIISPDY